MEAQTIQLIISIISGIPSIEYIYTKFKALGKKRILIVDEKKVGQIRQFLDADKKFENAITRDVEELEKNLEEEKPDELEGLKTLKIEATGQITQLELRINDTKRLDAPNKEATLKEIQRLEAEKQEKLEELEKINELETLKESYTKVKKFLEEIYPIYNKDTAKHYLAYKRDITPDLIINLKKSKKEKLPKELTLVSSDIAPQYEEFKEKPKEIEQSIIDVISLLPKAMKLKFMSLLSLSIHIDNLYSSGKALDAERIKQSIKRRYRYSGLKFCNLYHKGYLKNFFKSLKGVNPKLVERKCTDFLYKDTKAIFFLHKDMDFFSVDRVESELQNAFRSGQEYIAIHALGSAVHVAEYIRNNLSQSISIYDYNHDYNKKQDKNTENGLNDISMIWYKGDKGKQILKLLYP